MGSHFLDLVTLVVPLKLEFNSREPETSCGRHQLATTTKAHILAANQIRRAHQVRSVLFIGLLVGNSNGTNRFMRRPKRRRILDVPVTSTSRTSIRDEILRFHSIQFNSIQFNSNRIERQQARREAQQVATIQTAI